MNRQYRQGDVYLIEEPGGLPEGAQAVPRVGGRVVLALGEATGHAHTIADKRAALYNVPGQGDRWLVIRAESATIERSAVLLTHEEHGAIALVPAVYRVRTQREYSPDAIRRVQD